MIPTLQLGQLGRAVAPTGRDPFFNNVSLLLHGEGADAGTTITDSSPRTKTCTAVNEATTRTAQFQFGAASVLVATATNSSVVTVPDHADFNLGNGTFTLEMWVRLVTLTASSQILLTKATGTGVYPFTLAYNGSASGKFRFLCFNNASSLVVTIDSTTTVAADTWYFLQARRAGDTFALAVNGVQEGSTTTAVTLFNDSAPVSVGNYSSAATFPLRGYFDDVRITKGAARPFVLPGASFPDS